MAATFQRRAEIASLALPLLLGAALALWFFSSFTLDDPWISFRYAWQLAHGHGLVFNAGEHVEGYTNFLWTVLMAGVTKVGGDPLLWAKLIGLALHLATIAAVWWCCRRLLHGIGGVSDGAVIVISGLAAATYAASWFVAVWSIGALETPLFTALLVFALVAVLQCRIATAAALLFLAAITRPEGLVFFVVFVAALAVARDRPRGTWPRALLPFAIPYAAFELWRIWYYHALLPNTYYDKTGGTLVHNLDAGFGYVGAFAQSLFGRASAGSSSIDRLAGVLVVACAVVLMLRVRRSRQLAISLAAAWVGIGLVDVAWEGGDWMPGFRFIVPLVPFMVILLWTGFGTAWPAMARRLHPGRPARAAAALAVACLGCVAATSVAQAHTVEWQLPWLRPITTSRDLAGGGPYQSVARWVSAHVPRGSLVAIEEAGKIPYLNENVRFLDLFGLTDTHLARAPGEPPFGKMDDAYVLSRAPAFAVLWVNVDSTGRIVSAPHGSLMENRGFRQHYRTVFELPRGGDTLFLVYART